MSSFFKVGSNMRERCSLNEAGNRVDVLYSYETPVAVITIVRICGRICDTVHVTTTKHSSTTSRHINKWLEQRGLADRSRSGMRQETLDKLHHFINASEAKKAGVAV